MALPKAPSWFRKMLREFDPSLSVRHTGAGGWTLFQDIPRKQYVGIWNGMKLWRRIRVPEFVMTMPGIGTRVFDVLKRSRVRRYKNFDQYCKEMNINGYRSIGH